MEITTSLRKVRQLALFCERSVAPQWPDLAVSTRVEVVRLLAQLLVQVRAAGRNVSLRNRGDAHE
jgi:hypothetical protein